MKIVKCSQCGRELKVSEYLLDMQGNALCLSCALKRERQDTFIDVLLAKLGLKPQEAIQG